MNAKKVAIPYAELLFNESPALVLTCARANAASLRRAFPSVQILRIGRTGGAMLSIRSPYNHGALKASLQSLGAVWSGALEALLEGGVSA